MWHRQEFKPQCVQGQQSDRIQRSNRNSKEDKGLEHRVQDIARSKLKLGIDFNALYIGTIQVD